MASTKKTSNIGLKKIDKSSKPKRKLSKLAPIASKTKIQVKQYIHEKDKRANNPPVGLVTPESDIDLPAKKYSFDPHLDPQLEWFGKIENSDFEVDTVSLHRHERIDPMTIIGKILKKHDYEQQTLFPFFEKPENVLPLRDAIEFYQHNQNWSNRLIAGDSLLVMNSLLEKEGMEEKIQMIYMDPPYGIKYGSNFQPFVNNRNVIDGKDEDLTQEPEMIKAFRDTWEFEIHSYLTYMRNRLLLSRNLLSNTGSIFIQISDENLHHIKELLDEIFGPKNFVSIIPFRKKTMPLGAKYLERMHDFILWYAKDIKNLKYHQLYQEQNIQGDPHWGWIELNDGTRRRMTKDEINNHSILPTGAKIFRLVPLWPASFSQKSVYPIKFRGKTYNPPSGLCWVTNPEGMQKLIDANRIEPEGVGNLRYVYFFEDYPLKKLVSFWDDTIGARNQSYVVQTADNVIQRCMLMTTDGGDLVFDPTCGSGTTSFVAEKFGRRWITCDTSRIAITLTKQRLLTSVFDYYTLSHPDEGISSDLKYELISRITLKTIANGEPASTVTLYDKPLVDKNKIRITGPFTVEAVPSPMVTSLDTMFEKQSDIDSSIARTVENKRQQDWRDELLNTGVRGKGGQKIEFSRVEPHPVSQWIHAIAETKEQKPKIVAVSFGPEYYPLEQRQVTLAIAEAQKFVPKPELIIFASVQFDPEAAKDIDQLNWPGVQVLKVQVNADLFTSDLKKKRASNESFWLMGQPDVDLKKQKDGKYIVEVNGFDYYNTKTGQIESGDASKIAMWMIDTDYDETSLYPQQVFFPISNVFDSWSKLAKTLKSEINEQFIENYSGTKSLPFSAGPNKQVAVKIIDNRGIESLKIIRLE